ncbi:pyruvate kinase [Candidatus Wolfebacteria bacterium]|nr:pyruvate kinase [Candidatus Wolfebacteria bacterium]
MFKKTKIVASIGPATENKEILEKMALAGMNVVRLNFSHDVHQAHQRRVDYARFVSKKINKPIAVLQDLSGPKIRIGDFYKESIVLKNGQAFIITTENCIGDEKKVSINYKNLHKEIEKGATILLNDGKNELKVEKILGKNVYCRVVYGGEIKGRRGVNLPGSYLKISSLTEKDKKDLLFGIKNNVEYMAISFVRTPNDVLELRDILKKAKADGIKIIAKIETQEAIENLDAILEVADGAMVARGDLAVEVGAEQVPILQKMIIQKCNDIGKPVITATQMLESMIKNPVPTRAEVNDVANAILDGTDAIMLSEETTLGNYPVKVIEVMARVAKHTEENFDYEEILKHKHLTQKVITDSVSYAVVNTSHSIGAKVIIALTESGFTPRMISRYKPKQPILSLTSNIKTRNQLALNFGCYSNIIKGFKDVENVIESAKKIVVESKMAAKGDKIVISAGVPFGKSGATNLLIVQTI